MNPDREDERTEQALVDLRDMLAAVDPLPPEIVDGAEVAFAWRTVDADLAALVEDEAAGRDPVGVRGESGVAMATFSSGDTTIAVEVTASPAGAVVTGQLVPAGAAEVTAEWPDGAAVAVADEHGRFVLEGVDAPAFRLRVAYAGRPPVATDWLRGVRRGAY